MHYAYKFVAINTLAKSGQIIVKFIAFNMQSFVRMYPDIKIV